MRFAGTDGPPPVDPDEARSTAEEVLRGSEYDEPGQSIVERVLEWVFERLGGLVPSTAGGGGPGNLVGWLVVAALVAAAIWFIVKAARMPSIRRRSSAPAMRYGTESHRDAAAWLEEARRLAASGDHRGAIRCRHQALVARFVTDAVVDDVAGRTAGEYRDLLTEVVPSEADRLARLTSVFDDVWYGDAPASASDHDVFTADCDAVEQAVAGARVRDIPAVVS